MLCFPNGKINIGLYVTRRRPDGYHDIETIFYPAPVHDILEIVPAAKGISLHLSGRPVAGRQEDNLVWKALQLMQQHTGDAIPDLAIYLHKNIPMGAGLGGGSADGAFMLSLLNDFIAAGYSREQLAAWALELGSDCPFFVYNSPQYATGRGEQMQSLPLDLSAYEIKLVYTGIHVSTADAFRAITPRPAPEGMLQLAALPPESWKGKLENDFEIPVFRKYPELAAAKSSLYEQGAVYAAMTGSGSAVYGIFRKSTQEIDK